MTPWRELLQGKTEGTRSELAQRLLGFRRQTWLSVEQAAAATGLTAKMIRRYENDETTMDEPAIHALAKVYGRDFEDFDTTKTPPELPRRPAVAFVLVARPDLVGTPLARRTEEAVQRANEEARRSHPSGRTDERRV